jgi:predicted transposase/invertase (TIGR01784 family)
MQYLPTNNLLFLKCFSSVENIDVLTGFIKDVLGIEPGDLTIEIPYDIHHLKDRLAYTVVDVRARLSDGSLASIEMQIQSKKNFAKRVLYYLFSRYVSGYGDKDLMGNNSSDPYFSLCRVFGINICDFEMFADEADPLRSFVLFDTTYQRTFPEHLLQISFLQLVKCPLKGQENLKHWFSFFKGQAPLDTAPDYIAKAYDVVAYANLTDEERTMMDDAERSRADAQAALAYARDEGLAEGESRGRNEQSLHIARSALSKGLSIDLIQDITGLDTATIRKLQEN